jgi:hypothetical protein
MGRGRSTKGKKKKNGAQPTSRHARAETFEQAGRLVALMNTPLRSASLRLSSSLGLTGREDVLKKKKKSTSNTRIVFADSIKANHVAASFCSEIQCRLGASTSCSFHTHLLWLSAATTCSISFLGIAVRGRQQSDVTRSKCEKKNGFTALRIYTKSGDIGAIGL